MHPTTHYGEFKIRQAEEGSELAKTINRMLCQMRHPSMAGRSSEASTFLNELLGPEALPSSG